ncbi:MAG: FtsX-like permease family protein [Bryobacteraceae bacterium]|nr:FtsX-like permease family protein [Bryobacteraceae bacterium]
MTFRDLAARGLRHYWRSNLAVILGIGTAAAVLAGALVVGDSVKRSLLRLALDRLGRTDLVLASSGTFFRTRLAAEIHQGAGVDTAPLIVLEALGTAGKARAGGVTVYGVDNRFFDFHGLTPPSLESRQALLSEALARELGANIGDSLVLRLDPPSSIPRETVQARKDTGGKSIRLTIAGALPSAQLGEFSLRPQQGPVRSVFVPLSRLQKELDRPDQVNTTLIALAGRAPEAVQQVIRERFQLEDLGLRLRTVNDTTLAFESDTGLLSDSLVRTANSLPAARRRPIFTWLANTIRAGSRETPYSLVSTHDGDGILLTDWLAQDLAARPGDQVTLEYFVWQDGETRTESAQFPVTGIVPLSYADRDFAPQYPGITDVDSIQDWDPPFPVDLKRIRPKDEAFWNDHRTTPKAFIPLAAAQKMWHTRYGTLSSIRFETSEPDELRVTLRTRLDPLSESLSVYPVRSESLQATNNSLDFGQYFIAFSFFLVVSALLLSGLFFRLGIEQRLREIGLLRSLGFSQGRIRLLYLTEGLVLAVAGAALGAAGAIIYSSLVLFALRTFWVDAVGTTLLRLHATPASLFAGAAGALLTGAAVILVTLRGVQKLEPRALLAGQSTPTGGPAPWKRRLLYAAVALTLALVTIVAAPREAGFFGGGTLLLVGALLAVSAWLHAPHRNLHTLKAFGWRNAAWRPGRSVLCIALIAAATFLVVATDSFRRGASASEGPYTLYAESQVPLLANPNTRAGREALLIDGRPGLEEVRFLPFRLRPGDDVSCLNLYQPRNPRILGAPAAFLTGQLEALNQPAADGILPAAVDQNSLQYTLKRRLGEVIEIAREGAPPVKLRLAVALHDTVFQSELLVSEDNFVRAFPAVEGYRVFLIQPPAAAAQRVSVDLEETLADFGFDVTSVAERLANYHKVENTYLSTFQALGGLGLLMGTVGLAAVLFRNILERRRELALLRAIGYNANDVRRLVLTENLFLLAAGLLTGALCAAVAVLPAWIARGGRPGLTLLLLPAAVLLAGVAASLAAARAAAREELLPALRSE